MTKQKYMENGKPRKEKCIKRKHCRYRESQSVKIPGIQHNIIIIITIIIIIINQKALYRVPHSCIIKSLELIGINNKVIAFTKKVMTYWRTRMRLHAENELIETEDIKIQCGIF